MENQEFINILEKHFYLLVHINWCNYSTLTKIFNNIILSFFTSCDNNLLQEYIDDDLLYIKKIIELLSLFISQNLSQDLLYLEFIENIILNLEKIIPILEAKQERQYQRWFNRYILQK
jgi:hypothetical protein